MRLFGVGADPSPVDALSKARAKHARLQEQALAADDELVELKVQAQHAAEGFGTGLDDLSHEIAAAEAKVGALASAMNMGAGPSLAPPFQVPFQENHFPFGSVPHSIRIGDPNSFASRAQLLRSSSNFPWRIFARVNVFSIRFCSRSERNINRI